MIIIEKMGNYYWKFIQGYSQVASPFTDLLNKDKPWAWIEENESTFEALKTIF